MGVGGKRVVAAAIKHKDVVITGVIHLDELMQRQFFDIFGYALHSYTPDVEHGYIINDASKGVASMYVREWFGLEMLHGSVNSLSKRKEDRELRRFFSSLQNHFGFETGKHMKRFVVCAANRWDDFILPGLRHFCSVMHGVGSALPDDHPVNQRRASGKNQGFVDSYGNYLEREEAFELAIEVGQITLETKISPTKGKLFSEDLY